MSGTKNTCFFFEIRTKTVYPGHVSDEENIADNDLDEMISVEKSAPDSIIYLSSYPIPVSDEEDIADTDLWEMVLADKSAPGSIVYFPLYLYQVSEE